MAAGASVSDWRDGILRGREALMRFFVSPTGLFRAICLIACAAIYVMHRVHEELATEDDTTLVLSGETLVRQWFGDAVAALLFSEALVMAGFVVFAVAFCLATAPHAYRHARTHWLLVTQIAIGLLVNEELLLIVAAELPFLYSLPKAFTWLLAQAALKSLVWGVILLMADPMEAAMAAAEMTGVDLPSISLASLLVVAILMFFIWQLFAFCLGCIAMAERRQRVRLAKAHAELSATRQLLADSARASERLRISRDLHDGFGHHLAALNLHLDLAARQPERAASSLETARTIAKELYREVRTAVERERLEAPVDLFNTLKTLCAGMPGPRVELNYDPRCRVRDPSTAHAIFRGVQEALSNAIRHAQASRVEVTVACKAGGIHVAIVDDGRGAARVVPGNGLSGMRERIEEAGGSLVIETRPGSGYQVGLWLPDHGGKNDSCAVGR
ncbi:sensor histidine kinase [Halomonas sp. A29]|uniref:sensor histidine kinase n=1 Tax=Halomonas sp. A29 TaxID=3102786 RepID=UPI00398B79F3